MDAPGSARASVTCNAVSVTEDTLQTLRRRDHDSLATTIPGDGRGGPVRVAPDPADDPRSDLRDPNPKGRYELHATLGEGGMGEVLLCRDRRIGREIAMKVIRRGHEAGPTLRARFLREARVQGQLEHPAVVPVYDLADDGGGSAFFTMKRVRGETLEAVLERLGTGNPHAGAEYTRHKLLAAFARVCLAVHFAHTRGVVHRDLKPSNVMLGDFGEVYVLDWGVAKVEGVEEELEESGERIALREHEPLPTTAAGTVLGTPGYMAPEQTRGEPVDARTDVYALGAILFELLTLTPLHAQRARGTGGDDVPPELAAAWQKATAPRPEDRFQTARELHDAVERFLSGDRDLTARKALAAEHLAAARRLCSEAPEDATGRARALEQLGRAIALDPNEPEALRMLIDLLGQPPREIPREVADELDRTAERARKRGLRRAVLLYTIPAVFYSAAWLVSGVKSALHAAICIGSFLFAAVVAVRARHDNRLTRLVPWVTIASSVAAATSFFVAGAWVLLPTFVAANTISHAIAGRPTQRRAIIGIGILSLLVPMVLEAFGVLQASSVFAGGSLVVTSRVVDLHESFTTVFLLVCNVGLIAFTSFYVGDFRDALSRAEAKNLLQLWQLRRLVPEDVRAATSDRPAPARTSPGTCD